MEKVELEDLKEIASDLKIIRRDEIRRAYVQGILTGFQEAAILLKKETKSKANGVKRAICFLGQE